MNHFWNGFEKRAFLQIDPGLVGAVGGLSTGFTQGRQLAENSANALSDVGYKTTNQGLARNIGTITAPLGALLGIGLGFKHKEKIMALAKKHTKEPVMLALTEGIIPFTSGALGGMGAGLGTGALVSLRGKFSKKQIDRTQEDAPHGEQIIRLRGKGR